MLLGQHDDLNFANLGTCGHFIYAMNIYDLMCSTFTKITNAVNHPLKFFFCHTRIHANPKSIRHSAVCLL